MKEIWANVDGWEGLYEVSNIGRVRSLDRVVKNYPRGRRPVKGRILKTSSKRGWYHYVNLCDSEKFKNATVHRLVAKAFLVNDLHLPHINHLDGDKENNNADNLEWCTPKENAQHAHRIGLIPPSKIGPGEASPAAKLIDSQVVEIKTRIANGEMYKQIAEDYPVSKSNIAEIARGSTWSHIKI